MNPFWLRGFHSDEHVLGGEAFSVTFWGFSVPRSLSSRSQYGEAGLHMALGGPQKSVLFPWNLRILHESFHEYF